MIPKLRVWFKHDKFMWDIIGFKLIDNYTIKLYSNGCGDVKVPIKNI